MLVLTRKVDERLMIGETIAIKIVRITEDRVKLGIEAPTEVKILRGELKPELPPWRGQERDEAA